MRVGVQSHLPDSPADLFAEAQTLLQMVRGRGTAEGSELGELSDKAEEYCPACGLVVPFKDITTGVCANGHTWSTLLTPKSTQWLLIFSSSMSARCSITTFILATPYVRTCIGCGRKAFLPLSMRTSSDQTNWLPPSAQGWVVGELLEAVPRCLLCNNSFVRVL